MAPLLVSVLSISSAPKTIHRMATQIAIPWMMDAAMMVPETSHTKYDRPAATIRARGMAFLAGQRRITRKKNTVRIGASAIKRVHRTLLLIEV